MLCGNAFAQDLIMRNDGRAIPCKIVHLDSSIIVYRKPNHNGNEIIRRSEVQSYRVGVTKEKQDPLPVGRPDGMVISASFGRGTPIGDFGSQDINNQGSGLAYSGNMVSVSASYMANEFIGFGAVFRYQSFPFNTVVYADAISQLVPGVEVSCTAEHWKLSGFFARLLLSAPVSSTGEWKLDVMAQAGMPFYTYPLITTELTGSGGSLYVTESAQPGRAITFLGGGQLVYRASDMLALHVQADYITGRPGFMITASGGGSNFSSTYVQDVDALTFGIGISVIVPKRR